MLTLVNVQADTYFRYRGKEPGPKEAIEPGSYYLLRGGRLSDVQKKQFSPKAAEGPEGFCWLFPAERWIKATIDRFTPPEGSLYGKVNTDSPKTLQAIAEATKVPVSTVEAARRWQRSLVADGMVALERVGYFRRGVKAGLGAGKCFGGLLLGQLCTKPLFVAPKYIHTEWYEEAKRWGFPKPTVTTYESAYKFQAKGHDGIICDEVLCVKGPTTDRHRLLARMSLNMKLCVGMTGTPISVSPMDLRWLNVMFPGCVPTEEKNWRFLWGLDTKLAEVGRGEETRKFYETNTWDMDAIYRFVAPYLMVVDDKEIASELPEVTYKRYYVPRPKQYEAILAGAATEGTKSKALSQARQCSDGFIDNDLGERIDFNSDKIDVVKKLIEDAGEPVLIFANWTGSVDRLAVALKEHNPAVLKGGADYTPEIERFKKGETKVLIANARIAEGMNLQKVCRIVVFMSCSPYPVKRKQAIGRLVRPGQKDGVVVVDIIAENTMDDPTLNLLEKHSDESEAFVEAGLAIEFERQVREAQKK